MSVIWICDDSELDRSIACRTLASQHQVVQFGDGDHVVERIGVGEIPDVLVIDYHLPGLSGVEVTRHLRKRFSTAELPILILSGTHAKSEDVVTGLHAGANDYVIKPYSEIELRARVETLAYFRHARERAERAERSLRMLIQHLPDPFLALDASGRITLVNRATEVLLRTDWSALLTHPVAEVIPALAGVDGGAARSFDVRIGERVFEAAFGRLLLDVELGETITVILRDVTDKTVAIERRDQFLAMLAHELRNPLAPIVSATQLMSAKYADARTVERSSRIIARQADRLIRIVDDLLDVSRVTRGRVELRREAVDVTTAIERAVESTQPIIERKKHCLRWQRPPEPLFVDADPIRFEQMLTNLLNNASKYTEEGGLISVATERDGDQVVVRVTDNGIGIAPEKLETIFDVFVQLDSSLHRNQGGLGLGLSLVRQLAQMHGGSVTAFSNGIGRGSEFTLRLPATRRPAIEPQATDDRREVHDLTLRRMPTGQLRILLVDDNVDAVSLLAEVIAMSRHDVQIAHDGPSAIAAADEFKPQVVFLDIGLPGLDGYEVAAQLRARPELRETVLVALTGYGQREDVERAQRAGFDRHLVKPVSIDTVQQLLACE